LGVSDPSLFEEVNFIVLDTELKRDELLSSAILHATISDQIFELGATTINIPEKDILGNDLTVSTGVVVTNYLIKTEIKAIIKAMLDMGYTKVADFNTVNLEDTTLLKNNMTVMLESAIIHSTISDEILNIGSTVIVPEKDIDNFDILVPRGLTTYITSDELEALVAGLDLLGVSDPALFEDFTFASLDDDTKRTVLLESSILHATISDQLLNLSSNLLYVPEQDELGTDLKIIRGATVTTEFVAKVEIKAIIEAMLAMGYIDVKDLTNEIDEQKFIDNMSLVIQSASMQATVSNQILGSNITSLIIPDVDETSSQIRIIYPDVTFIESNELEAFFISIDLFATPNLDFDTFSPSLTQVQTIDRNILFNSYIMLATVSDYFLDVSGDESEPYGTTSLLVPTTKRIATTVDLIPAEVVEKQELIYILDTFDILGLTNYNDPFDADTINNLTSTQIDQVLLSDSVHVTIDNMIRGNANVAGGIPALAEDTTTYTITVTTKTEIKNFIIAVQQFDGVNFTNVSFSATAVATLNSSQRDLVLDSMIVRNILTPELETMGTVFPFSLDPYVFVNSDYMNDDMLTFLTEIGINNVFTHYGLI
ncbi:MAG: hypothetical protein WC152_02580, partial [Candidatus Izemoplasmatales bacterium]